MDSTTSRHSTTLPSNQAINFDAGGKVLDGRNRLTACKLAGVEPKFEPAAVNGSAADYVFAMNFHRRHLTDGARQLAAGRYKDVAAKEAKERQKATLKKGNKKPDVAKVPPRETGKARDVAAAKFDVGGKTVDAAAKVLKKGSKELVKAVERGATSNRGSMCVATI